jgi:putative hydrolase of the HAD superfamily
MSSLRAVIFDLGGTLIDWSDYMEDLPRRWGLSYSYLISTLPRVDWPTQERYVQAMREAEQEHWQIVDTVQGSTPPQTLIRNGFDKLGIEVSEKEVLAALDSYGQAISDWSFVFPDAIATLTALRKQGYRIGLLSNTWWAASWHNAELAAHGLAPLLDEITYTSDLPHSKPHPSVFLHVAHRLHVAPQECVMVGDRMIADVSGAMNVGMRGIWRKTDYPWPKPDSVIPTAIISNLAELLPIVENLA